METWFWVVVALVSLVSGGLGGYVAAQKGRPLIEGVIFGLLIGPFGVIAVAGLPTIESKPIERRETITPGETITPKAAQGEMRIMRPSGS